ncbi:MAG: glycosyltransferase, partial [bacterium]
KKEYIKALREFLNVIKGRDRDSTTAVNYKGLKLKAGLLIARCFKKVDKLEEAIKQYGELIKEYPFLMDSYTELGDIYFEQKKYIDALKSYQASIDYQRGGCPFAYLGVSKVFDFAGSTDKATDVLLEAIKFFGKQRGLVKPLNHLLEKQNRIHEIIPELEIITDVELNREDDSTDIHAVKMLLREETEKQDQEGEKIVIRPGISLCMIVKNEEKRLGSCLDSIKYAVEEIIVVDTGSSDKTVETARRYGAKVINSEWDDSFSAARNISLDHAGCQWILWTDADDIFPGESVKKILQIKNNKTDTCYGFRVKCSVDDDPLGPVLNQIRMFPNSKKHRFRYRAHEQILPSLQENGIKTLFTDIIVTHTGYDEDSIKPKQVRNKRLIEMDIKEYPDNPGILYGYANALLDLNDLQGALDYYMKVYKEAEKQDREKFMQEGAAFHAAAIFYKLGDLERSNEWLGKVFKLNSLNPQAMLLQAEITEKQGNLTGAQEIYEKILDFKETSDFLPYDYNQMKIKACSRLRFLYQETGNKEKAHLMVYKALCLKHGEKISCFEMGTKFMDKGPESQDFDKAEEFFILGLSIKETHAWNNYLGLSKLYFLRNEIEKAFSALSQGMQNFPAQPELYLYFGDLLLKVGKKTQAEEVYRNCLKLTKNEDLTHKINRKLCEISI